MKKSENFILNDIAGNTVLVPVGDKAVGFNGIITLNDTAKFLWENIDGDFDADALIRLICESYEDVDKATAEKSADKFISTLKEVGAIE
ncbi:MAG: PqqD family protein [Acutalibacteraceae bacterium]